MSYFSLMIIAAKDIDLFENLAQWDAGGIYYDFHNDFICSQIKFNVNLTLYIKGIKDDSIIEVSFRNATLINFEFAILPDDKELIIDLLYRGRFEKDGQLLDISDDGSSYFYLEFYDEQKIEFFSSSISIVS